MTEKLAGKIAVVTGGSAGVGLGIAEHFAAEGARVFITGRHQSELDKAVTTIGGNAAAIQSDTSNLADLDRIYAIIKAQAGHIDVLAANAGVYEFAALGEITEEHFDRTFNTNVRAACCSPCKRRCRCYGPFGSSLAERDSSIGLNVVC